MFQNLLRRHLALIPIVAVVFMMTGMQPADAVVPSGTANLVQNEDGSVVTCSNEQGTIQVHLVADPSVNTEFMMLVNGVSEGADLSIPVAAGQSTTVPVSNLDDTSTASIEVIVRGTNGEDGKTVLKVDNIKVACDTAPTGPYPNPKGSLLEFCGTHSVSVTASNAPIGDNFVDLQPVTFTVTFVSNAPVAGSGVQQLDKFTLPSGEDDAFDYHNTYTPGSSGVVSLYADKGMTPVHLDFSNACTVVSDGHHPKHHGHHNNASPNVTTTLPNTGLTVRQWQAVFGLAMLLSGIFLVKVSRRPVRVRIKR